MASDKPKSFDERCYAEATANAIFLFQRRMFRHLGYPSDYMQDDEGDVFAESDVEMENPLDSLQLSRMEFGDFDTPCAIEQWITEKVFLTREEGEAWGKATDYNYREGWRVYCVPAHGQLVEIIKNT